MDVSINLLRHREKIDFLIYFYICLEVVDSSLWTLEICPLININNHYPKEHAFGNSWGQYLHLYVRETLEVKFFIPEIVILESSSSMVYD